MNSDLLNPHLAIMARRSKLGEGKTRLAATLGAHMALNIYRELIALCAQHAKDSGLKGTIFFEPEPGDFEVWDQTRFIYALQDQVPDLGQRLKAAFAHCFANGHSAVMIVGTDCPGMDASILKEAAHALANRDMVIGPSEDGGYYLLGLRQIHPSLFENINWSTDQVFQQTCTEASHLGLSIHVLPMQLDIDTESDWRQWKAKSTAKH